MEEGRKIGGYIVCANITYGYPCFIIVIIVVRKDCSTTAAIEHDTPRALHHAFSSFRE